MSFLGITAFTFLPMSQEFLKSFFIPPATYPVLFFNETAGAAQEWFSDQAGDSFPSCLLAFEGNSGIQAGTTARLESSCFPSIGCLGEMAAVTQQARLFRTI